LLLAGLGADVIKIEDTAAGDGTRGAPPFVGGGSAAHATLNRGKRSVQFNLKEIADRELFLALVAHADVVVDSFRPGVLDRLVLGDGVLEATNPALVHVSLVAYDVDGARALLPGHDLNAQALSGVLSLTTDDGGRPAMPGVQSADLAAGTQVALAVLAGLWSTRTNPAEGARYFRTSVSMLDSAYGLLGLSGAQAAAAIRGESNEPGSRQMLTGALACYDLYECSDGAYIAVGALEPQFFVRICELLDRQDLTPLQYNLARQDELRDELSTIFSSHTRGHWTELLSAEDTCVTPVLSVVEALGDPDATARALIHDVAASDGSALNAVRTVPWLPAEGATAKAPVLGADNDDVRAAAAAGEWPACRPAGNVGGGS